MTAVYEVEDTPGRAPVVVVLTALPLEYAAVRAYLEDLRPCAHRAGTLFEVGTVPGTAWRVALAEIGTGSQGAAVITERAAALFRPRAVLFVGVAGGLREDIAVGDVVVATKVHAYQGGRESDEGFQARPSGYLAPHHLEQRVRLLHRTGSWVGLLPAAARKRPPRVHLEPIAAGDVVLRSVSSALARRLRGSYNDAVAVETEGAGVVHAAHLNHALSALIVRGISDRVDGGERTADAADARPRAARQAAARHAAALAVALVRELALESTPDDLADDLAGDLAGAPYGDPAGHRSGDRLGDAGRTPSAPATAGGGDSGVENGNGGGGGTGGGGRPRVLFGGESYVLHEETREEHHSADGSLIERQSLALRGEGPRAAYVWLRQVTAVRDTLGARDARQALAQERDVLPALGERVPGLPRLDRYVPGRAPVLSVVWPRQEVTGHPCETLATAFDADGRPLDPWRRFRLFTGLAALCDTLAGLHELGFSHRRLGPSGIVVLGGGPTATRFALRDLGLACRVPASGDTAAGESADVHRLAVVCARLVTGRPAPGPSSPLPQDLPRVLHRALAADPADRPHIRTLQAALRRAAHEDLG
ncbi:hypothetical protein LRS74_30770 [Streptomyces sp. LX-29]|uniref:phosphorylase family protein n=1 Tax=Streptomyces sp. LX-29 TaxID=2900152 RepID=UPI00240E8CE2|nr:hypothetical protein [Streptomyces sp. LX-29]WFB10939.1 hypothetical protein LRS74_30770 [Streptomyces sp. LX-29]